MKKFMSKALLLLVCLTMPMVASAADLETPDPVEAPGIKISQIVIDYGKLEEGPTLDKEITLTNVGSTNMEIANVSTN